MKWFSVQICLSVPFFSVCGGFWCSEDFPCDRSVCKLMVSLFRLWRRWQWGWVWNRLSRDGRDRGQRQRSQTNTSFPCTSGPETLPVELERFLLHDLGIINPWLVQCILYPHQRLVIPPPPAFDLLWMASYIFAVFINNVTFTYEWPISSLLHVNDDKLWTVMAYACMQLRLGHIN